MWRMPVLDTKMSVTESLTEPPRLSKVAISKARRPRPPRTIGPAAGKPGRERSWTITKRWLFYWTVLGRAYPIRRVLPNVVGLSHQALRLTTFFSAREFVGAGVQQAAAASAATRLQSSGCPSQQSLTRKAITDRIPSTSER